MSSLPRTPKPSRDAAAPVDPESRAILFASVMANAKDSVLVTEAEPLELEAGGPRIIYVNEAFTAMTGYSSAEAVGSTPRMLQSPRTNGAELDRLRRALAAWEPVEVELLNVRKDGTEFWVQFVVVPVADPAGWYTHWVSIQRDVTDRRRQVDELNAMVRGTRTELVLLVDREGIIRAASPAAERTLAFDALPITGSCVIDRVLPEHQQQAREALTSLQWPASGEAAGQLMLHTSSGWCWFDVTARTRRIDDQDATIVITAEDATERRRSAAALHAARQRFHGAFEDAPIGMAVHDERGALVEVNSQLSRLLGRDKRTLLTLSLDDLVHRDDRRASRDEREQVVDGTIAVGRRETRLLHADGRTVGVMLSSSVVRRDGPQTELVVHVEDISERQVLEARLTHQAMHDALTHLPNRVLFLDRLEIALRRGERAGAPVSVLFLDLDQFKAINDSHGHKAGDEVLTAAASRLKGVVRPGDTAARFGGDEFTILCDGAGEDEAFLVAERIADVFEVPIALSNRTDLFLKASIGVATLNASTTTADQLLRDADVAMYAAKGTDTRIAVFDERMKRRTSARINHRRDLSQALERDELTLRYQPVESLAPGSAAQIDFEALVRWLHPVRGLLSPDAFIPLAEESGLITAVDRWVLRRACEDAAALTPDEVRGRVWVNISLSTLSEPGLVEYVESCLTATGLPAAGLGLELTERAAGEGGAPMQIVVERLRALGIQLGRRRFRHRLLLALLANRSARRRAEDRSLVRRRAPRPGAGRRRACHRRDGCGTRSVDGR